MKCIVYLIKIKLNMFWKTYASELKCIIKFSFINSHEVLISSFSY